LENTNCEDDLSSKVVFEIDSLDDKVLTNKRKSTQTFYLVCHKDLRVTIKVIQDNTVSI